MADHGSARTERALRQDVLYDDPGTAQQGVVHDDVTLFACFVARPPLDLFVCRHRKKSETVILVYDVALYSDSASNGRSQELLTGLRSQLCLEIMARKSVSDTRW